VGTDVAQEELLGDLSETFDFDQAKEAAERWIGEFERGVTLQASETIRRTPLPRRKRSMMCAQIGAEGK
jgi:hypothetical protein